MTETKAKYKKSRKPKAEKPKKAKPVKIMSDELERLKLAQETLGKLIEAKKAADLAEIEMEQAKDAYDNRKGAAKTARLKVSEIISAWERPLPLFDQPNANPAAKPDVKPIGPDTVVVLTKANPVEIPEGIQLQATEILPGGIAVQYDGHRRELADNEFQVMSGAHVIDAARGKPAPVPTDEELLASVKVRIKQRSDEQPAQHELPIGSEWPVSVIYDNGLEVAANGDAVELLLGEYDCDEQTFRLINEARDTKATYSMDAWLVFLRSRWVPNLPAKGEPNTAWRSESIAAAGINGNIAKLLEEGGVETLGALADVMNSEGQWWHKKFKGLGEQSAAKVADAFAAYWGEHPEYCAA